jgi:hypothetical protein
MQLANFDNTEQFIVSRDGRPFYLHTFFLVGMICCGLYYFCFLLTIWVMPGASIIGQRGKNVKVKIAKVMLY